jgi:ribosome-associated protein
MGQTPEPRTVEIRDASIRLGQLLKLAGIADSGAEAKELLADGGVTVNGEPETRRGRQVRAGDVVPAAGEEVTVSPRPGSPGR